VGSRSSTVRPEFAQNGRQPAIYAEGLPGGVQNMICGLPDSVSGATGLVS